MLLYQLLLGQLQKVPNVPDAVMGSILGHQRRRSYRGVGGSEDHQRAHRGCHRLRPRQEGRIIQKLF